MTGFTTHLRSLPATSYTDIVSRAMDKLLSWQERIGQRRRLSELSDHELADMGLDRATAIGEAEKPFWRP